MVISGVGQSDVGRRLGRSGLDLTLDACLAAITDAGLTTGDIDAVSTFPGALEITPGFSPVGVADVQDALRLELSWFNGGMENPGQLGPVITACAAIAAGLVRHALCFRTVTEGSSAGRVSIPTGEAGRAGRMPGLDTSWFLPFGAATPANLVALYAARHFHEFGTTRQQLAQVALTARANAGRNPKAVYRHPLTMDDYLQARMVSRPLCLYDCDVPCDGSTAVILSAADTAADLRRPPLRIQAVGSALRGRPSWDQWDDLTTMAMRDAAGMLWSRTDLTPGDVDMAQLYDGFSFFTLAWLEALGFCPKGEGGPFLEGGKRIRVGGELPLNTGGGQLSAGRLSGFGHLHEGCVQLWGEAGPHQLLDRPEVGVVAAGGGPLAGCLLLTTS